MVVHTLSTGAEGKPVLVVSGEDLTLLMDLVDVGRSFPAMPVEARVQVLLAGYGAFGIVPLVDSAAAAVHANPGGANPASAGDGLRVHPIAGGRRRVSVHAGSGPGSDVVARLLGTGASRRSLAPGAVDRFRQARQHRDAAIELRCEPASPAGGIRARTRIEDGGSHPGAGHRRARTAARRGRPARASAPTPARHRQAHGRGSRGRAARESRALGGSDDRSRNVERRAHSRATPRRRDRRSSRRGEALRRPLRSEPRARHDHAEQPQPGIRAGARRDRRGRSGGPP